MENLNKELNKLRKEQEEISSGWNGESESFVSENGFIYHEEDATLAGEIVDAIDNLTSLINQVEVAEVIPF